MSGQIRVFIACSLDGFIAGPEGDLSWLPPLQPGQDYGYAAHMADTAAILMGRTSYDAVRGFDGPWPYGETPVFVATSRPLGTLPEDAVREVDGAGAQDAPREVDGAQGGAREVDDSGAQDAARTEPTIKAVSGEAADLIAAVQAEIGDGGIYLDGGALIRSVLDAGLVDQLVVTVIPIILGDGTPLFTGVRRRHELELLATEAYDNGLVQLRYAVTF